MLTSKPTRVAAAIALAVLAAGPPPDALAKAKPKPVVAPRVIVKIAGNGGGNRLDLMARVETGRPDRSCTGVAKLHGRTSRLRTLVTGTKGGRQWHWYLGDGAKRGRLTVRVTCRFPDGKAVTASAHANVGPGPYPRRAFKHVVHPGSLRVEGWAPIPKYPGSGGAADLYPHGQCTWYVARQRPDLPYFEGRDGDAKNWIASAERRGLPTGREPRVGAVAVFQPGQYGAGIFGHVAIVTKVDGDRMTVQEANYGNHAPGSVRTTGWVGVRFIYKEALPVPAPAPTSATPLAPPAKTAPLSWPAIDLATAPATRVSGASTMAAAGDVNDDGAEDLLMADADFGDTGQGGKGAVWVVFGSPALGSAVDLLGLGTRGFRIEGAAAGDWAGSSVAGIGDVNGDGKDDILIGAQGADNNGRGSSGSAYVVFGKADASSISLGALSGHGYRLDGGVGDGAGGAVARAGDVNGDGRTDFVIGAAGLHTNNTFMAGGAYVVYGQSGTADVDLATLTASTGFRIDGAASDSAGVSVAGVGDLDGDGFADVAIGAPGNTDAVTGRVYLVMGIDSANAQWRYKITITGAAAGEWFGTNVAGVGDVDGDGRPDLAIGAPGANYNSRASSGAVYVVLGKKGFGSFNIALLGSGGFRIEGAEAGRGLSAVAAAGDVNGDQRGDLLLARLRADFAGRERAGSAAVVFGGTGSRVIDLASLAGDAGFGIGGPAAGALLGSTVAGLGDVNGDRRGDFGIEDGDDGGYVVYGPPPPAN
jgi:hypothetical protein